MEKWKVKYTANVLGGIFEGGPDPSIKFWRDWFKFNSKETALEHINKTLPQGGMGSQVSCAYLFKKIGHRWTFVNRYYRKTEYSDDKTEAYPVANEIEPVKVPWKKPVINL